MLSILNKNSISDIAIALPPALVDTFEKHNFYSIAEVKSVFNGEFKTEHNIDYAFAMFCTQAEFEELNLNSTYIELRTEVSKQCFESWPRFNFETLLDLSRRSTMGVDGGGYADGGCGGE